MLDSIKGDAAVRPAAKFLGNTDDVTTCDCCGRADLKSTVALLLDGALDPVYYGVTCAAHALSRSVKEVRSEARAADRARIEAEREAAAKVAAEHDAKWQSHLDSKAGTGPDVWDDFRAPSRFKQIQKLGGFAAARAGFAS